MEQDAPITPDSIAGNKINQPPTTENNSTPEAPLDHLKIDPSIVIAAPEVDQPPTRIEVRVARDDPVGPKLDHLKIDPNIYIARPSELPGPDSQDITIGNQELSDGNPEVASEEQIGIEEAREAVHSAFIKKMRGPVYGGGAKELTEEYIRAHQQYADLFREQLTEELEEKLQAGMTVDEAKQFIKDRVTQTIHEDEVKQNQMLKESYGAIGKAMEWYGKQKTFKKIAIGAGLGVAAMTVGVGVGLAGGLIGAGVAATGVFSLASRTARAYFTQLSALFKDRGNIELTELDDINNISDFEGVESLGSKRAVDIMISRSTDRVVEAEKIKKRAVKWAIGAAALVGASGVIGAAWHVAQDASLEHLPGGQIQHQVEDMLNPSGTGVDDTPDTIPVPEQTVTKEELIDSYIAEHAAARKIRPGEGWYQTFKELGIKQDNWDDLLKETGPELENIEYKGTKLAYWDDQANEWRMNMTEKGKMPKSALRLLIERAEENGYLKKPLGLENIASTNDVAPEASAVENAPTDTSAVAEKLIANPDASAEFSAASTLSKGESVTSMLNQLNRAGVIEVDPGHYNALMKVAGPQLAELRYGDGTPVAYLNRRYPYDWRLYMSPDSRLHPEAIRLLERLTRQGNYTLGS